MPCGLPEAIDVRGGPADSENVALAQLEIEAHCDRHPHAPDFGDDDAVLAGEIEVLQRGPDDDRIDDDDVGRLRLGLTFRVRYFFAHRLNDFGEELELAHHRDFVADPGVLFRS